MCGIVGALGAGPVSREAVCSMTDALRHRGPDEGDVWQDADAGIALGHRRLSILELTQAGHQPMHSPDDRYVIAFNGEIYNHLALRERLDAGGGAHAWRGHSDTETLLAAFSDWGVRATLEATVGMFAIALWDRRERRLYLARDRFGEKPLYYGWSCGAFLFGSELKALRQFPSFANAVDRDALALYMQFAYVPAPYSIYRDIFKLEPGCILSLDVDGSRCAPSEAPVAPHVSSGVAVERYWSIAVVAAAGIADPLADEGDALSQLEASLVTATRLQSVADVPLGAFLSGGIDSSTVVALMQAHSVRPVQTFTIGFAEGGFDESEHAAAVARHLGTDHTNLRVTPEMALELVPSLSDRYTEPFADSSQIPTTLVAMLTRQHVTVALSGDGGDELFGGYNRYSWGRRIWKRVSWMPAGARRALGWGIERVPATWWDALNATLPATRRTPRLGDKAQRMASRMRTVASTDDLYRSLVTEWEPDSGVVQGRHRRLATTLDDARLVQGVADPEHRMMLWDAVSYLPGGILQKVDRAAMSVSLETRAPFLDHRVAALAWRLPLPMKFRDGRGKYLLRRLLYRHVPDALVDRPKAGFGVPVGEWVRAPLRDWAEDLLSEARLRDVGLLEPAIVRECWREHVGGGRDWTGRLWPALMLQAWAGRNAA